MPRRLMGVVLVTAYTTMSTCLFYRTVPVCLLGGRRGGMEESLAWMVTKRVALARGVWM